MATGSGPQKEDGYTAIANELMEALSKAPLRGQQFRCLMFLFRQTYGYNRKEYTISLAEWEKGTGMKRQNVWRELELLIQCNVIYKRTNGPKRPSTWGFNKHYDQWNLASVIADDDKTVITDDYKSVVTDDDSLQPSVIVCDDKSVITPHERNKESKSKQKEAAAAFSEKTQPANFAQAYQRILGKMVESPHRSEEIQDWEQRVPYPAWEYALQESLDKGHRHDWKYTTRILERLEREGYEPRSQKLVPAPATLDFVLEDTYA